MGGSAVPAIPMAYGQSEYRQWPTIAGWRSGSKWPFVPDASPLFRRQDGNRNRILFRSADLQHERARRELILHGLTDAVAVGGAAEGLGFEEMPILHHIDPAARGQADRVEAGPGRRLDAGEAGKGAVLGRPLGRRRQFGLRRAAQGDPEAPEDQKL